MDRETILLVHPEADELDRIEALVQPLGLETRRVHDFPSAVRLWQIRPANLVVCTDIDVPEHKPQVVEEVRRATSRLPVVVLIRDRSQAECPKATRLLTGLQQYLAWPQEAADLPAVARALLRTSRYLNGSHHDQLAAMRGDRDARRMRETLSALRTTLFQQSIERDVRRFAELFAKPDLECRIHVEEGRTAHVVTEAAKRLEADLIVMGTVTRTGIPGLINENAAEDLLADLHCSVLAVKPPDFRTPVTLEGE